jgi:hypothetical protein
MTTLPLAKPANPGKNWTLKLVDCPGFKITGTGTLLAPKPLPVTVMWVMERAPVPLFVNCTVCEAVEPSVTSPKAIVEGALDNAG